MTTLYHKRAKTQIFLLPFPSLSKKPRYGFALESQVPDLFAVERIKVIAIHDLAILLVSQAASLAKVDRFVLITPKGNVYDLGQYGLDTEVICAPLSGRSV